MKMLHVTTQQPEAWRKEYYPVSAKDVPKAEAVTHSLVKWRGLRKETLASYGLSQPPINVDFSTCALCYHYLDMTTDIDGKPCKVPGFGCSSCLLCKTLGEACDMDLVKRGPYSRYIFDDDPEPMIEALEECLKQL